MYLIRELNTSEPIEIMQLHPYLACQNKDEIFVQDNGITSYKSMSDVARFIDVIIIY